MGKSRSRNECCHLRHESLVCELSYIVAIARKYCLICYYGGLMYSDDTPFLSIEAVSNRPPWCRRWLERFALCPEL
jgi:hypothetical protein